MDSILDGFEKALQMNFNASTNSPIIEITNSIGSRFSVRVNAGVETFAISSLQFAVSSSTANTVLVSVVDPASVSYLRLFNFGSTPALTTGTAGSGVVDLSIFQNLTSLNFQVLANNITAKADAVYIAGAGNGAALNAGNINCVTFTTDGNAISLALPLPTRLQKLFLINNRLGSLTVPAGYNALTEINLGDGGAAGANAQVPLGTLDASGAANLTKIIANDNYILTLVFPTNFSANCLSLDVNRCRISATNFAGSFEAVRALVAANTSGTLFKFRQCALSGAEQTALVTAVWTNRASRPQTGTRLLHLDTNSVPSCYPNLTIITGRYNAGIVDTATRSKVADLRALGWTVLYNAPTLKITTSATAGQLTLTYEGDQNIDIWAAGDTITQTVAQSGGYLPTGNYTVVSGSGKVWEITASFATSPGAVVVRGTFDK